MYLKNPKNSALKKLCFVHFFMQNGAELHQSAKNKLYGCQILHNFAIHFIFIAYLLTLDDARAKMVLAL